MSAPTITRQAVLRRAAEILQANGRTVETYYDIAQNEDENVPIANCRMCTVGALGHATGLELNTLGMAIPPTITGVLAINAGRDLIWHLGLLPKGTYPYPGKVVKVLGEWNDNEHTTDEQVLAALNATADALDAAQEA